jgi:chromate transporter
MSFTSLQIFWSFFKISFISFGGVFGVLPELEKTIVSEHAWLTHDQFIQSYVTAQFMPGPNMVMCPLIGFQINGISGFLAGFLAVFLAPTLIMGLGFWAYSRYRSKNCVRKIELSLRPLVIGLLSSSALRLWWEQSRSFLPSAFVSSVVIAVVTLGSLALLKSQRVSAMGLLVGLGMLGLLGRMLMAA